MRPPPCGTPAHSFRASGRQAARGLVPAGWSAARATPHDSPRATVTGISSFFMVEPSALSVPVVLAELHTEIAKYRAAIGLELGLRILHRGLVSLHRGGIVGDLIGV